MSNTPSVRQPRQNRSKASQEKIFKGAIKLLTDKGPEEFTLQELSKRTKVSVGSIYYRFENKDILLSELQKREYQKMWDQLSLAIESVAQRCQCLTDILENANRTYAEHLRDNAPKRSQRTPARHHPETVTADTCETSPRNGQSGHYYENAKNLSHQGPT